MFKRICAAVMSLVVLVSFFCFELPSMAFTDEDAYSYSAETLTIAMKKHEEVIDISAYMLPASYAEQLYYDVLLSDPYLYSVKMNYTDATCTLSEDGLYIESYNIEYCIEDTTGMDEILKDHIDKAVAEIPVEGMHTVDLMLAVHEYIASNVDRVDSVENVTDDMLCSSAYGALVYGCADSLGYAILNMTLAEEITGNRCIVVSDEAKSLYWNLYLLNGNWYNIDVYSDDTESFFVDAEQNVTSAYTLGSVRNHIYFLETNEIIGFYGHSAPVAYIYEGTPVSENDSIRIRIWNNIVSPMYYYDGYWHFISPANPDMIVKRLTNVVATSSYEITVCEADGVLISFSLTDDCIYYLTENKTITKIDLETLDSSTVYKSESDSECLIGMGNRDDQVYYETYDSSELKYSYNILDQVNDFVNIPLVEDSLIIGVKHNSKVKDLLESISKTGIVNRYDAYNKSTVSSGEDVLTFLDKIATDMSLSLTDGSVYKIIVNGDVVPSGDINIIDIMTVINYIIGTDTSLSENQILAADCDDAEGINIADVAAIYNAMMF